MLTADNNTDESRMKCEFIFVIFCIMKHFPAVLRIEADLDLTFLCNADPARIWILILVKVMRFCDCWSEDCDGAVAGRET